MATELAYKSKHLLIAITVVYGVLNVLGYDITVFFAVAFLAVVFFGMYSAGKVAKMASQFDPCENAKEELEAEIEEAKNWYKQNGHSRILEPKQEKTKAT